MQPCWTSEQDGKLSYTVTLSFDPAVSFVRTAAVLPSKQLQASSRVTGCVIIGLN